MTPTCKQRIKEYFSANPKQRYFAESALHVRQNYHIEFKDSKCLLYAFGQKTLSEAMLERGLAVKQSNFEDDEFKYLFTKAQYSARIKNMGIWSDVNLQSCVLGIYK